MQGNHEIIWWHPHSEHWSQWMELTLQCLTVDIIFIPAICLPANSVQEVNSGTSVSGIQVLLFPSLFFSQLAFLPFHVQARKSFHKGKSSFAIFTQISHFCAVSHLFE